MKKLAIVVLLVLSGCRRQAVVATGTGVNVPGATSPREALQRFMAAAKAQDLQAFANIWGSSSGPARATMGKEELEMREITLMCFLKHDSYQILGEAPAPNGERVFALENKLKDLTRTTNFYATRGPENRWYIRHFEPEPLNPMCSKSS